MDDGSKSNFGFPGDKKTYMFEKKYTKIQVATNASFAPGGSFEGFRLYDEHGQMFFEVGNLNFQIKNLDLGKTAKSQDFHQQLITINQDGTQVYFSGFKFSEF